MVQVRKNLIDERGIILFIMLCMIWWILGFVLIETISTIALFKFFNLRNSPLLNTIMPAITTMGEGWLIAIVIIIVMMVKKRFRNFKFLLAAIACMSVPSIFTNIIKRILDMPRPLKLWHNAEWIHQVPGYEAYYSNSHPSGHTTGAFSLFCFLSLILSRKWSWVAIIYFGLALLTGFSRIYLAQHFFDDIWAGSIMGTTVSYLIFKLFYWKELN